MELEFLDWLRTHLSDPEGVAQSYKNDAAVLTPPAGKQLVVTTDAIVDGTHFEARKQPLSLIGRKALAVNLSDIAAMAAEPMAAFISVVVPHRGFDGFHPGEMLREVYRGIIPLAQQFGVTIAGGDTNVADAPLTIAVTLLGQVDPGKAWRRDGAKVGDAIYVTGPLGGSIARHHLEFTPRVSEAQAIAAQCDVHAAMDISDGLSLDLWRICEASGVGAELDAHAIPIADAAHELASESKRTPLEHALGDGEDFELLIVAAPVDPVPAGLHRIGEITDHDTIVLRADGVAKPILPNGFEHR